MRPKLLITLFLAILALPALFVYVADPYQYFHKSFFAPDKFLKGSQRFQMPGILRHYVDEDSGVDTIIAGASLAQNYDLDLTAKAVGGNKAFSLSFPGGAPGEQALIIEKALKPGHIKHVFWTIDPGWRRSIDEANNSRTFPHFLYNSNWIDDLNYAYGADDMNLGLSYIMANSKHSPKWRSYEKYGAARVRMSPYVMYGSWAPLDEKRMLRVNDQIYREGKIKLINKRLKAQQADLTNGKLTFPTYADLDKDSFKTEKEILTDLFERYPDVEFTIVAPPIFSLFYYSRSSGIRDLTVHRARALVEISADYPNAQVYGFNDPDIINDIRYYKDEGHYDRGISRYILRQIADGERKLTLDNVDDYTDKLIKTIHQFDVENPFAKPDFVKSISFEGERVQSK